MDFNNELIKNSKNELTTNRFNSSRDISTLTSLMVDNSMFKQLNDVIDESGENDFSSFNDLEMIYFYVHQQKDLNDNKNRMENTKKEYVRDLLIFYKQILEQSNQIELSIEAFEEYQILKRLSHRNIRKYQEWIKQAPLGKSGKPYAVATLNRKMVIIKGFFYFLYSNGYISLPLHEKMLSSNVRASDRPDKEMSSVEFLLLLRYFKNHPILYSLISVLGTTGLRVQELCKLRVCDLSYVDGGYWLKVMGKGRKEREVLIHENVLETIKAFRQRRRVKLKLDRSDTSPLFTTAKGKAYTYKYLSNYITQKINAADIDFIRMRSTPITCHTFRHCFALISAEQGAELLAIKESLGHSDIKTTMIYLQRKMARKNNAAHTWKDSNIIKNI
ncbi:integrase [Fictibacillus phosphorivorans]|uniref:Integrase n=1 Tax=Fictibacillus phosphorivorans TaxID=1221500 RepID=A0A163S1L6_9BACL|nr:tyrosine-type recombinase/integrase [Fictibacillus phosphorivorans]KZE67964.1 integrase [Fictibacillus phosphorivorans]